MTNRRRMLDLSRSEMSDLHHEISDRGIALPLELGGADETWWADCDLASLAENRLGEFADARTLDAARRKDWQTRATVDRCTPPSKRAFDVCFWLLDSGERIGTVALASSLLGSALLRLSSLYVFPVHRGRGAGSRALAGLSGVLAQHAIGLRLETSWSWQKAVRFYLRTGFWLQFWKHDLAFRRYPDTPPPILSADGARASVSVDVEGRRIELARAERSGDVFVLHETGEHADPRLEDLVPDVDSTFSLWLALNGWPLIRSAKDREAARYADAGPPEALADRIVIWEAWDRAHGWRVDAPRVPGLEYRAWTELGRS